MRTSFVEAAYFHTQSVEATCRLAGAKFGISRSTVIRTLKALRLRWAAESTAERDERRAELRAGLVLDLAAARTRKAFSQIVSLARLLAELDGLLVDRQESEVTIRRDPLAALDGVPGPQRLATIRFIRQYGRFPDPGELVEEIPALPAPKTNGSPR